MKKTIVVNDMVIESGLMIASFNTRVYFTYKNECDCVFENEIGGKDCGSQTHDLIYKMIDSADRVVEEGYENMVVLFHGAIKTEVYLKN